jgi:NTP pyrophosphatase (non-canonical NTP hydrolase)
LLPWGTSKPSSVQTLKNSSQDSLKSSKSSKREAFKIVKISRWTLVQGTIRLISMTQKNDLQSLSDKIQAFCEARDWDQFHPPKELAIGISTEAAELLDLFRFKSTEQIQAMFADAKAREKIEDEMADVFFFILRMSQMNSVDLTKAVERKLEKNALKYPVETAKGSNKKYNE